VQVVDRAALSLADDKTLRAMPTHFLLTGEVKRPEELENADFLLTDHPLAPIAVDLLLGTQGWRRFAEQDPTQFRESHGVDAERLLASSGQTPLVVTNRREAEAAAQPLVAEAVRKAQAEFSPTRNDVSAKHYEARQSARAWKS